MATYYFRNNTVNWGTASNWSTSSGGPANGAVPTSADNAILDANSGGCTMNVAGVCASVNFSAYTSTLIMTNGLTVSGNVTLGSGMTITGTSTLSINATATLTSNGKTWPNSITSTAAITFADAWTIGGNFTTSQTVTLNGNLNLTGNWVSNNTLITVNGSAYTVTISSGIRTGGGSVSTTFNPAVILNGTGTVGATANGTLTFSNFIINTSGTITLDTSTANKFYPLTPGVSTFNYSAGTVVTASSVMLGAFVFNSGFSNIVWSNLIFDNAITTSTFTFNSHVYVNGTLTFNAGNGTQTQNHNGAYKFYVGSTTGNTGNLSYAGAGSVYQGTMSIEFTGTGGTGTWTAAGTLGLNVIFNTSGTLTLSSVIAYTTGTITYTKGNIICDSTLNIQGNCTLSTNTGVIWTNISCLTQFLTITLGSDVYTKKLTYGGPGGNNQQLLVINGNTLYLGSLIQNGGTAINSTLSGTATLYFNGTGYNTITIPGNSNATVLNQVTVNNNIIINTSGTLAIIGVEPFCYGSGTLTYLAGNVYSNITQNTSYSNNYPTYGPTSIMTDFYINGNCTLVNIHKIPFKSIQIAGGSTLTMNQFFNGTPKNPTYIQSSNTTNYIIQFQDNFEKISNFIKISNCALTKPLQLLITTKNANKGSNIGIRYINQLPNGVARKTPIIPNNLTGSELTPMVGGLLADPSTGGLF